MGIKVGINGFGSIGRRFFRQAAERPGIDIVGINDTGDIKVLAHLLKRDSTFGAFPYPVTAGDDHIEIAGSRVSFFSSRQPEAIPWGKVGAQVVIEATSVFTDATLAAGHLRGGAERVIIAAPSKNADVTLVPGVNDGHYLPDQHRIVSMASCTTNCLAPVALALDDEFGLVRGLVTTIHSYTADQRILDMAHEDWRRARAAACNIIPTSTGAARAVGLVLPHLQGRLNAISMRVPVPYVSVIDLVAELGRSVTADQVNQVFIDRARGDMAGILTVTDEPLVSGDIKGDPHSAVVDLPLTMILGDTMVKVVAWYDNEWGYSARLCDLVEFMGSKSG